MELEVVQDEQASRFEAFSDGDQVGYLDYRREGDVWDLPHTVVLPAYEGQGVGSRLVLEVLEQIRNQGGQVLPSCPFIPAVLRRHPDLLELVPEDRRGDYGL